MKTIKYLSFFFFLLIPVVLPAQSAKQQAQALFSQAKYSEAASLCYGAAAMESKGNQQDLYALAKKCENCINLSNKANALYSQKNFEEALAVFKKLLAVNPSDSAAKLKLNACNKYLNEAVFKKDEQLWQQAVAVNTVEAYNDYINNNPNGKHIDEARQFLDEKFWQQAVAANSIKAIEGYLRRTQTDTHVEEAKEMLAVLKDEAAWKEACDADTRLAYQSYLDNNKRYSEQAKGMIAKYDARDFFLRKDYDNALKKYRLAEIYVKLSGDDIKFYSQCLEESLYSQIMNGGDISQCLEFFEKCPTSVYKWKVSDRLARLYADSCDFGKAAKYAVTKGTKKYIKSAKKNAKKGTHGYKYIPFHLVEEKPLFMGGDVNAFSKWVNERLVYPEPARENGVYGRVTLQFTVNTDGSVSNVKVLRGVDSSLDKEAVRVVSMSPKWSPGKYKNRVVNVLYTFPVIFQLK